MSHHFDNIVKGRLAIWQFGNMKRFVKSLCVNLLIIYSLPLYLVYTFLYLTSGDARYERIVNKDGEDDSVEMSIDSKFRRIIPFTLVSSLIYFILFTINY